MAPLESGWGLQIILWFQSWRTPLVETIAIAFHYMGLTEFYIAILPFIYWCVDAALGRRVGFIVLLSAWLNNAVKSLLGRPRPYFISTDVNNVVYETGYGVPSGHAQGATALVAPLAWEIKRRWVTIAVVVFILLMSLSRMVLGVHYPQDVLAGVLLALLLLGLYILLEPRLSTWLARQSLRTHIVLAAVVTALLVLVHPVLLVPTSPEWLEDPVLLVDLTALPLTTTGTFFGLAVGFALDWHTLRFNASGTWGQRLLRYALGIAVILALRFGLGMLLEPLQPEGVFRFIRYGVIGLWAGYGAPWLFVRLGLARRETDLAVSP